MSYKSFLKFQVGIISLGAFQAFCESRVNTKSPWSNGSTTAKIDLKNCIKTSDMSKSSRTLETRQRVKALEGLSGAVSAYDENSSDYFYLLF